MTCSPIPPTHSPETLRQQLMQHVSLVPWIDDIMALARPCVHIELAADAPTAHGSRLGGSPWAPPDFVWPEHRRAITNSSGSLNWLIYTTALTCCSNVA